MKKLLALVLALVMTLSLCVTSNAAYKDAADVELDEAVDVLTAVGVFQGDENGNMNPKANLTREQAAKLVSYLQIGQKAADALVGGSKFTDVAKTSWSAGYVDYCAATGVVAGVGDGKFDPAGSLTALQFGKMLLVCLGYDAKAEGLVGTDWSINTSKLMTSADLLANLSTVSAYTVINREQAAQMMLNAIKAPMVEYANKATSISVNGADIVFGGSTASFVSATVAQNGSARNINGNKTLTNTNAYTVELGEKLFKTLVCASTTDAFGRPAHKWSNDKKDIGTYVDYNLMIAEFTKKVTYKDLYETIGATNLKNKDFIAFEDGVETEGSVAGWTKTNKNTAYHTGNGVLTQIFVDNDTDLVTVAVINTYLAQADADYSAKNDTVKLTVYGINQETIGNRDFYKDAAINVDAKGAKTCSSKNFPVLGEDVAEAVDLKEDDFVLVTVAEKAVQTISAPKAVENTTIENFKTKDYLTAEGTKYEYATTACFDPKVLYAYNDANMKNTTYNLYLDEYGYVVGAEIVEEDDVYVFITGYESFSKVLSNAKAEANAIFTDGTCEVINVNIDRSASSTSGTKGWKDGGNPLENKWYTYSVDKNGNYDLKPVTAQGWDTSTDKKIDKSHTSLKNFVADYGAKNTVAYGNDETVYLTAKVDDVNGDDQIVGVSNFQTGLKNVSIKTTGTKSDPYGAYFLYNSKGYVIAAVVVGTDSATTNNYVFVTSEVNYEGYDRDADEYTWTAEGIVNGEQVTLTEVGSTKKVLDKLGTFDVDLYDGTEKKVGFWKFSYDANGNVVGKTAITWDGYDNLGAATYAVGYKENAPLVKSGILAFNSEADGYDKDDVVLVNDYLTAEDNELKMTGHTLYTRTSRYGNDYSLDIAPDAKAVLIDQHDGKWETEYFNADSGNVKAAIAEMEDASYDGYIFAVMKDGVATSVIIVDGANWDGTPVEHNPVAAGYRAVISTAFGTVTVTGPTDFKYKLGMECAAAALENAGYVISSLDTSDSDPVYTVTNKLSGESKFTVILPTVVE